MSQTIASLVANISANTSGLEAGLARSKSMIQSTAGDLKSLAGSSFTAQGAMDGWTKSKYAAAAAGGLLTEKAFALEKAVSSGSMTAAQANKEFKAYRTELQQGVWQTMTFNEKAEIMRQRLSSVATAAAKMTAAGVAVGYVAKQGYELAKSGAEIAFTEQKFGRLAESVGSTSDVFLNELRVATRGTLSDFQLMRQGSDLLQLGLAKDSEEAVRLSRVMTALGMDTGEMTLALANQSKRRLDQLGLSLSAFNAIEGKLKDKGLSKEDAFKEAFMQTAEQTVMITGNKADTAVGSFMRLEAAASNLWNTFKQTLPDRSMGWMFGGDTVSQTAEKVGLFMSGVSRLMSGETVFDLNAGNGMWTRAAQAQDISSLWANRGRGPRNTAITGLSAAQNYTAMAFAYGGGGGGGGLEGTSEDVAAAMAMQEAKGKMLLEGGLRLTQQTEQYTRATSELNIELARENEQLELLKTKYGENSDKVAKQTEKVNDIKNKIQEIGTAAKDSGDAMLLSTMQNMGATDQQALAFARASGLISEQAYVQQNALNQIAAAYNDGKISADNAAMAGQKVFSMMQGIDGAYSAATIDIFINYIVRGGGKGMGAGAAVYDPKSAYSQSEKNRAVGGPVVAGGMYNVTEYGQPEILSAGGQNYLMMGNQSGYVTPLRGEGAGRGGGGGDVEGMYAMLSRMPSEEGIAKAMVRAMSRYWSKS